MGDGHVTVPGGIGETSSKNDGTVTREFVNGAAKVEPSRLAGERRVGEADLEYFMGVPECNGTILDGTSAVAISANPVLLFAISFEIIGTTATVSGLLDQNGSVKTKIYTATAEQMEFDLRGCMITTCTITPSVDDDVTVFWREQ